MIGLVKIARPAAGIAIAGLLAGCAGGASGLPSAGSAEPTVAPAPTVAPSPTIATSPITAATPAAPQETWQRGASENLGYTLALPPGSYLAESVPWEGGQGPYDQWMVMSPEGGPAFGLLIGHGAAADAGTTMPPPGAPGLTEVLTADGVRVLVGEASGIDIIAGTVHGDYWWMFMAESGDIVGNDAKRSLLLQVLSTFRFAGPDFVPPTPVPTASP